jgi:CheY-like chemotaxis protein
MAKILVVDDDPSALTIVADWLKIEEHEVDTAGGGLSGWDKMQTCTYDLIILDWDMPDLTGIDLLKQFRDKGDITPTLMLTGRTSGDDKVTGLDVGADDYLTKPVDLKELSARIRAIFRKQRQASRELKALGSGNDELLARANLAGTAIAARYEFMSILGEGGMGIVFKARHPELDRLVAIKMLLMAALKEEAVRRFQLEAKMVSRLEHPGIASVFDFGTTEKGHSYMIMEFIPGRSLDVIIEQYCGLPLAPALDIAINVCTAMAHAHSKGILHRDLKPSNVMMKEVAGSPPAPKILDFGCGKFRDLSAQQGISLTQDGRVFGSPPYMSPEQVRGKPVDETSDIYSLGCVIYELLAGFPPFLGDNVSEVMFKHIEELPPPLAEARPDKSFPSDLEEIVAKALAKEPSQRYPSMADLKASLEKLKSSNFKQTMNN